MPQHLREAVLDPNLERVVLIGHSQGGIIVTAMIVGSSSTCCI